MLIDKLMYILVPRAIHEYAADNRAKIRANAVSVVAPAVVFLVHRYVPEDMVTEVLAGATAVGSWLLGRSIHKVVRPWEQDA